MTVGEGGNERFQRNTGIPISLVSKLSSVRADIVFFAFGTCQIRATKRDNLNARAG